jgi:hypothetical protein
VADEGPYDDTPNGFRQRDAVRRRAIAVAHAHGGTAVGLIGDHPAQRPPR